MQMLALRHLVIAYPVQTPFPRQPYARAVWTHGAAALLELLAEPAYAATVSRLQLRARGYSEAAALAAKSLTVLAALRVGGKGTEPAAAFALGQLSFGERLSELETDRVQTILFPSTRSHSS